MVQEASREGVRRQEAAISRLHQRSRECFRQLKAAHPAQQTRLPSQERELHTQPSAFVPGDHTAHVQPMQTKQGLQREQQLDEAALESQPHQPRSASPVKGIFMHSLTNVWHYDLSQRTAPTDKCCSLWFKHRMLCTGSSQSST